MHPETRSPRDALAETLPFLDAPLAHLTGRLREGQILSERTKLGRTIQSFAVFWFGVACGVAALPIAGLAGVPLMLFGWGVAVSGARDLQLTILHHGAHDNVFPRKREKTVLEKAQSSLSHRALYAIMGVVARIVRLGEMLGAEEVHGKTARPKVSPENRALGSVVSTTLLIVPFDEYVASHVVDHHGKQTVSTCADDTRRTLKDIGIREGAPIEENRRRFLAALVSPAVHGRMLKKRLLGQFTRGTPGQRLMAWTYVGAVGGFTMATGWWIPVLLGWALPLTVGYQAAQLARFVVEHSWPDASETPGKRTPAEHDALTVAVRCAVPPPASWSIASALSWAGDMALNVLVRCTVLPGDSGPSHGWHHDNARGDWANHIARSDAWERERLMKGLAPTREAWGFREALRLSLESFAKAKPEDCRPEAAK